MPEHGSGEPVTDDGRARGHRHVRRDHRIHGDHPGVNARAQLSKPASAGCEGALFAHAMQFSEDVPVAGQWMESKIPPDAAVRKCWAERWRRPGDPLEMAADRRAFAVSANLAKTPNSRPERPDPDPAIPSSEEPISGSDRPSTATLTAPDPARSRRSATSEAASLATDKTAAEGVHWKASCCESKRAFAGCYSQILHRRLCIARLISVRYADFRDRHSPCLA